MAQDLGYAIGMKRADFSERNLGVMQDRIILEQQLEKEPTDGGHAKQPTII